MNTLANLAEAQETFDDIQDFRRVQAELEINEPSVKAVPYIWKWDRLRERLTKSETFDLNEVHRRAFALCNPGLKGKLSVATTMFTSVSMYLPGDGAPAHRHHGSASRFVIEGEGFTNVAGERLNMSRGDLVITPFCEWHDHGNDSKEPVFWIDVLDVPLIDYCNAMMVEFDYAENGVPRSHQSTSHEHGFSSRMFGGVGVMPRFGWEERKGRRHTPKYFYASSEVREAQEALRKEVGSPFDGIIVEYVDPSSGRSVVPTMSFCSQLLRPRERTWDQRKTASTVFSVSEGSGVTVVNGQRLEWSKNDIFVVPGWYWYHHENLTDGDAILYSVSDEPAQRLLGCFVSQGRDPEGRHVMREPFAHRS